MSYPPEQTVIDRDRTVVLDEAEPSPGVDPAPKATSSDASLTSSDASLEKRERVVHREGMPWQLPVALGLVVALVVVGVALMGEGSSGIDAPALTDPAQPADTLDVPPAAPNAELTIGTADSFTSTIRVGDDQDLFGTLSADLGAGSRLGGAPVSGDAVVVQQVFGSDAFSVISATGGTPVLVYLPGATDELVGFVPGATRVVFVGTLHPAPADLGTFLGSEPGSIAARSGAYVVAVPETVVQVSPPSA